jgi:hypothetical protein
VCLAPQEKLPWSEEVLVSKAELEERRTHVSELEQQVAELTMQTEYQLRLKDLHVQVCACGWQRGGMGDSRAEEDRCTD